MKRTQGDLKDRRKKNTPIQDSIFPEFQAKQFEPLSIIRQNARWIMGFFLVVSDTVSILVSFSLAITFRSILIGEISAALYWNLILFVFMFIFFYAWFGLYPGVGLGPVDEIKKLLKATSAGFLILTAYTFFEQTSTTYSRFILGSAWLISLVLVQLDRWILRIMGRELGFWGEPVVIIGNGPIGQKIANYLNNNLRLGMRPYMMLGGNNPINKVTIQSINKSKIATVILVIPEMSEKLQHEFIYQQRYGHYRRRGEKGITRLILISSLSWVGSLGITVHDLDGMMGLEIRQNLLQRRNQILKRISDLSLTIFLSIISLPFMLFIAGWVSLDSPGGVFYKQKRVGQEGKIFEMWKFRTMYKDSEQILDKYLEENPSMREEWLKNQKIRNDPRITNIGRILRKLSLDELPQFINILKGEMSLVGPRPFFSDQQKIYGTSLNLYKRVRPGITGMWQVRGRNRLSFRERVRLDEYYIRNWSIWLDIYIALRTIWVVINQHGAY